MRCRVDYEKPARRKRAAVRVILSVLCIALGLGIQRLSIEKTGPALETLARQVREGMSVSQAVEVFCREVFP